MIAPSKPLRCKRPLPTWHAAFLAMLPAIREQTLFAFRKMRPEAKEDAVEEVICNSCAAFARLVERGKADVACPTALANFAIRQFRAGRHLGCRLNIRDVSSEHCRLQKRVELERLDRFDRDSGQWEEILLEDRHAGPAETAAARIDIGDWLREMRPRARRIAQALAAGERTKDVARRFKLSPGRISQLRDQFRQNWRAFQGEADTQSAVAAGAV